MITRELFEDLLTWTREHGSIPRISAVCTQNGHEIFSGGRGHRAHAETRYPIASITKTFTAHLVQQAVHENRKDLTTPVQNLLTGFRLQHPSCESLTLHRLLNHQTPLPVHAWAWLFGDTDRRTFVETRLPNLECFDDPRPRYRYSNIMYAVLGLVVEELLNQTWEDALQARVLDSLNMDQTLQINPDWQDTPHLAPPMIRTPHGEKSMPAFFAKENHLIAPASEVISTAHDLTIWAQHANRTEPWKSSDPVQIRSSRPSPELQPLYSSNGWRMETYGDHRLYWHSGQCSGYTGILACIPDRSFTLAALCNLDSAVDSLQALMYSAADLALSRPAINWFRAFPAPAPKGEHKPAAPTPSRFPAPGTYINSGYGSLEVDTGGQALFQNRAEGFFTDHSLHFPLQNKTFRAMPPVEDNPTLFIDFEPAVKSIPFVMSP